LYNDVKLYCTNNTEFKSFLFRLLFFILELQDLPHKIYKIIKAFMLGSRPIQQVRVILLLLYAEQSNRLLHV
jgi:hypothetical protein